MTDSFQDCQHTQRVIETDRLDRKGNRSWPIGAHKPWWSAQYTYTSRPLSRISFEKLVGSNMVWNERM